jgi:hypothetical protein
MIHRKALESFLFDWFGFGLIFETESLCSPGGLKLLIFLISISQMLRLQAYAATPGKCWVFFVFLVFLFCAGYQIQGLAHARKVLYH